MKLENNHHLQQLEEAIDTANEILDLAHYHALEVMRQVENHKEGYAFLAAGNITSASIELAAAKRQLSLLKELRKIMMQSSNAVL